MIENTMRSKAMALPLSFSLFHSIPCRARKKSTTLLKEERTSWNCTYYMHVYKMYCAYCF